MGRCVTRKSCSTIHKTHETKAKEKKARCTLKIGGTRMVLYGVTTDYVKRQLNQEIAKVDSCKRQKHKCSR